MGWVVYMLVCSDQSFYTGITNDLVRRVNEHASTKKGARYTRAKRPVHLVYWEHAENRSVASKREYAIRKLSREHKIALVESNQNCLDVQSSGFVFSKDKVQAQKE